MKRLVLPLPSSIPFFGSNRAHSLSKKGNQQNAHHDAQYGHSATKRVNLRGS